MNNRLFPDTAYMLNSIINFMETYDKNQLQVEMSYPEFVAKDVVVFQTITGWKGNLSTQEVRFAG